MAQFPSIAHSIVSDNASAPANFSLATNWVQTYGNALFVFAQADAGGAITINSVTDNCGHPYYQIINHLNPQNNFIACFWTPKTQAVGSGALTVTIHFSSASSAEIYIVDVSPPNNNGLILDFAPPQFTDQTGNTTTTCGPMISTFANELFFGYEADLAAGATGPGTGWTGDTNSPTSFGAELEWQTQAAAGTSVTATTPMSTTTTGATQILFGIAPAQTPFPQRIVQNAPWRGNKLSLFVQNPLWNSYQKATLLPSPTTTPPPTVPTYFSTSYPDRMLAAVASAVLREDAFFPAAPPVLPTFSDVVSQAWGRQNYPERVLGAQLLRALYWMHSNMSLAPERTSTYLDTDFPDRILSPPPRGLGYFTEVGKPEITIPLDWYASYPDFVRSAPAVAQQRENAWTLAPAPERTSPLFSMVYQDQILGAPPRKDYFTEVGAPERTQTYIDQDFPDRILPAARARSLQELAELATPPILPTFSDVIALASGRQSYPERALAAQPNRQLLEFAVFARQPVAAPTEAYWSYPDQLLPAPRTRTLGEWTLIATPPILPIFSDVVAQAWGRQSYPDRVPAPQANRQLLENVTIGRPPAVAPTEAYWSYPDQVLGPPPRRDYVTEVGAPERTAPLTITVYPDQVLGAPPRKDYATEIGKPEVAISLDWYTSYPERVLRQPAVAQQQTFTSPIAPERTTPIAVTVYPDQVIGPPARQHFTFAWPIQPPVIVTKLQWWSSYPDAFPPRVVRTLEHLAATEQPPLPQPNVVPQLIQLSYPEVIRPSPQYWRIMMMQPTAWRPNAVATPKLVLVSAVKAAGS